MTNLSGATIKSYALRRKVTEGGFGAVYYAFQPLIAPAGREVAIKVIRPQFANIPSFIRRFEAEAQTIARLEHPHIVPLYDYWRDPSGAYLVMRWMPGGSLAAALQRGPLPLDAVARVIDQVAAALAFAHARDVLHRDLKPANILLDSDGNAYLADFGIAADRQRTIGTPLSEARACTPGYAAPEQITFAPATPQSDLYSLGVLLYELLTGVPAFQGTTPGELAQQQLAGPPPRLCDGYPYLPLALDAVIQRASAPDPAARYTDALHFAADVRSVLAPLASPRGIADRDTIVLDLPDRVNPYKGLRAFQEADAADFFGRAALTHRLLERLKEPGAAARFLAVVGPSGSGKSSVVRAGLMPALRRGALPGSSRWFIVDMIPGAQPLEELEAALLRVAVNPPASLLAQLRKDERGLLRAIKRVLPPDEAVELALVIDQFEELFTLVADEALRVHVLNSLLTAIGDPRSRLRVVVTLRADFYDRPLLYPAFGELIRQRTEVVLPLASEELEQAIIEPARRMGVTVAPEVVTAIVDDVEAQPGALPLLQYVLTELWEQRTGRKLTLEAYRASGGVQGALARRADALYLGLDAAGEEAIRQVFLRLITLGEGTEDTRRRVRRAELVIRAVPIASVTAPSGSDGHALRLTAEEVSAAAPPALVETAPLPAAVVVALPTTHGAPLIDAQVARRAGDAVRSANRLLDTVLELYGGARLLTFDRDPVTREPTVELAHEALIRNWQRLRGWLNAARADLRVQRQLATAAAEWTASGRDTSFLASGARLNQFAALAEAGNLALNAEERAYLDASIAESERQATAERERQRRELAQAQALAEEQRQRAEVQTAASRRLRRRAVLLAGALVLALLATVGAVWFSIQSRQNELAAGRNAAEARTAQAQTQAQLDVVESQRLADIAQSLPESDIEAALLLAHEAATRNVNPITERALRESFARISWWPTLLTGHTGKIYRATFSPDGQRIVTASADKTARIWDASGKPLAILQGHTDEVVGATWSPDGRRIVTPSFDKTARLWDANGKLLVILQGHTGKVYRAVWSPDGRRIVTASEDGTARLWDADGTFLVTLQGHTAPIWRVAWSPDGQLVATASFDKTARLWDASGKALVTLEGHTAEVTSATFSPDGQRIVTTAADQTARLWDRSGKAIATLEGHNDILINATWSPDGKYILTTSFDKTARLWDVNGKYLDQLFGHTADVNNAVFSPDGKHILTASSDGTARLWEVDSSDSSTDVHLKAVLSGHAGEVNSAMFSPDGQRILTASSDGTARLWETAVQPVLAVSMPGRDIYLRQFSPDGQRVLVINGLSADQFGHDRWVELWNVNGTKIATLYNIYDEGFVAGEFNRAGDRIITLAGAPDAGPARLWDGNGKPIADISGPSEKVWAVGFSPDGSRVVSLAYRDNTARLWDKNGKQLAVLQTGDKSMHVLAAAFSPDGQRVVIGGNDIQARVWEANGTLHATLKGHTDSIVSVEFSPDGQHIVTGSLDKTARLWDIDGHLLATLTGHTAAVRNIAFSPDGQRIVTTAEDGTRLWDAAGKLLAPLLGQKPDFTPDGQYILTVNGGDNPVRLWNVNGTEIAALPSHNSTDITFSRDGRSIDLIDGSNNVKWQYPVHIDDLLKTVACKVGRGLTEEEIARFQVSKPLRFDFAKRQCPPAAQSARSP